MGRAHLEEQADTEIVHGRLYLFAFVRFLYDGRRTRLQSLIVITIKAPSVFATSRAYN